MADPRSFTRGEAYFAEGRVHAISEHRGKISATVHGSEPYSVELWQEGAQLAYDCSCPVGEDDDFCKHCVAVGLALLAGQAPSSGHRRSNRRKISLDDVRRNLEAESKEALLELLVERAAEDASFFDQLRLRVAKRRDHGSVDIEAFKGVLRRTITPDDFLDWRSVSHHAAGIDHAVDSLEELVTAGNASAAIELAEFALDQVEQAMGSVDDSDGEMGTILERLGEIHHRACKKAKPEAVPLAQRLFEWELQEPLGIGVDPRGVIWVACSGEDKVVRILP